MNNTRIVATIGPATNNAKSLLELKKAGMSIARLNGSHNSLDWHKEVISLIHRVLPDTPILLDIPGRKIRTTQLASEPQFDIGDIIILTTDISFDGKEKVPVNYENLHNDLEAGQTVLADDGTLKFTITKITGRDIYLKAETPGCLKSKKGINVPYVKLNTKLVTERDRLMLKFAQENEVDFIGLSFVESKEHVQAIRDIINPLSYPRIVSKIENQGGINNMEEIIEVSDAIMIDRGDLSMETELDSIALMQKEIILSARRYAKPVIVATELLHSMIENSFPTKAEVCDISNAVLDGCAAVMLSGETAIGKNPVEAVSLMTRVVAKSENYLRKKENVKLLNSTKLTSAIPVAIGDAIEVICNEAIVTKIVAITRSGFAAKALSTRNLTQPILAISDEEMSAKSFNFFPGVKGIYFPEKFPKDNLDHVIKILEFLRNSNELTDEDLILVTAVGYPNSGSRMNMIQTHLVKDLAKTFHWK
ncbi:pyruvate kinase [Aquirufa aurantiipilula]|uniref:pyruvate kinase n=1 Tax=Aquirufa aurantiipilula TaxID=2696561 RepID=UPI001CAA5A57|nr:pyruvate kinase [Aquirufa aurantiipilula]MBZ1326590.1 pyruvate kinase [Aquirufa aurantiipilula]